MTCSPVATRLSARVVGTPRWCIASLQRNSRIDDRSTARPSALREYGVGPAPLSCSSQRSPAALIDFAERDRAAVAELPGPLAELVAAVVRGVRLHALEQRVAAEDVGEELDAPRPSSPKPTSAATSRECATSRGAATGVGH